MLPASAPRPFRETMLAEKGLLPIDDGAPRKSTARPASAMIEAARRRLVYQELFMLQLALRMHRGRQKRAHAAPAIAVDTRLDARIRARFPFEFTAAQRRVCGEIAADLARPEPMNRLLQGDVGSGKTAVAIYAMLAAVPRR